MDIGLSSGTTALHLAAFAGELDTVKLLTDVYKADVNKQDKCVPRSTQHNGHESAFRPELSKGNYHCLNRTSVLNEKYEFVRGVNEPNL